MIPAFGLRSSVVPEFPAGPLRGQWPLSVQQVRQIRLRGNDTPARLALGRSGILLQINPLLASATPATVCRHDQVPQVDRRVAVLFSDLPPVGGLPGRFHHPCPEMARAGPSRSMRPPAWGQYGVLYNNQESLMTAFTLRSCWKRHLPHVALGTVFSFALSELEGLASPAIWGGQRWSGTLASRRWTM